MKKKLGRQFKLDVWIVKNWQFKQNIQIELIKIDNSNKTFKLNWKKLQIQTKYSNWIEKKLRIQTRHSNWIEKIENSNQKIKLNWNILILNNWILMPLKLNMSLGSQEWECLKCVSVSRFQ